MGKAFAIICLLALATLGLTKAMAAGKVILALNCGSKDEVVDSHDKVFKYQAVCLSLLRTKSTSQASLFQSTTIPMRKPPHPTFFILSRRGYTCTRDIPISKWSTLSLSKEER